MTPIYGQVVAGPPASGKTTYCTGMQEYLRLLGRDAWVINLDPANEIPAKAAAVAGIPSKGKEQQTKDSTAKNSLPYETLLDVCDDVVNLSSVMTEMGLGPNGGLLYCVEYLEAHVDDLVAMIRERVQARQKEANSSSARPYLIFDLPGQVELYTHSSTVQHLFAKLSKVLDLRLVAIQLIDAHYCTEASSFLSAALLATTTMLRLELPTVSVLSKVDLLANYGPLPMNLEYFTKCQELDRLIPFLRGGIKDYDIDNEDDDNNIDDDLHYADDPDYQKSRAKLQATPFFRRHEKLHKVLAEAVDDFGLLSFIPLDISSAESVGRVVARVDKANGYVFTISENISKTEDMFQCAVQNDNLKDFEALSDIQERLAEAKAASRPSDIDKRI